MLWRAVAVQRWSVRARGDPLLGFGRADGDGVRGRRLLPEQGRSWAPGTQGPGPGHGKSNRLLYIYVFLQARGVEKKKAQSLDGLPCQNARTHEETLPQDLAHEARRHAQGAALLVKKKEKKRRRNAREAAAESHTRRTRLISRLQRSRRRPLPRRRRPAASAPPTFLLLLPGSRPLPSCASFVRVERHPLLAA